jgi:Flp pilus assembly pilin Flp
MNFIDLFKDLHRDEDGATATEYVILLVLVACFVIAIVKVFGETLSRKLQAGTELVSKEVTF